MLPPRRSARRSARLAHELIVAYRSSGGFLTDYAINLSRGGCFVNARRPLPVGTPVSLVLSLPGEGVAIRVAGRVTWVSEFGNAGNDVPGMGIAFVGLDEKRRRQLSTLVTRLRKDIGAAPKKPAVRRVKAARG